MTERRKRHRDGETDAVIRALASSARQEPPEAADRRIRALIGASSPAPAGPPRPLPLLLTGAVSLLLLGLALGLALAQTPLGRDAPLVAVLLISLYLGLSATAALPLLVRRDFPRALTALRVNHEQ